MTREVELIHQILNRYKFIEPVHDAARVYLPASQKQALKYCLKKTGYYTIWFGLVIFILFAAKRFGFKISLAASKVLVVASIAAIVAAATGGIVIAAHQYLKPVSSVNKSETPVQEVPATLPDQTQPTSFNDTSQPIKKDPMEITLYSGRKYIGVIISRGKNIVIETPQGEVSIPSDKVKMIRRSK